ncbi:MAG: hypothetical protein ACP5OR_01940 [Candidatus Dormibacteria bacterium]
MNFLQRIYDEMSQNFEDTREQTLQQGHTHSGQSFFDLVAPEMVVRMEDDPLSTTFLHPVRLRPAQLYDAEYGTWVPTCLVRSALESEDGVTAMVTVPEREPVGVEVVHRSRIIVSYGERTTPARELLRWSQHFAIGVNDIVDVLPYPATPAAVMQAALDSPGLRTTWERLQGARDAYVAQYTAALGFQNTPRQLSGHSMGEFAGHGMR